MLVRRLAALLTLIPALAAAQEPAPDGAEPPAGAAEPEAAEPEPPRSPRLGVGAAIYLQPLTVAGGEDLVFGQQESTPAFLVPFHVGDLRVEPELAYLRSRSAPLLPLGGTEVEGIETRTSVLRIGVGVAYEWDVAADTRAYAGARFGVVLADTTVEQLGEEVEIDRTDTFVGVGLGGEAFLTSRFSLGVEARLEYLDYGTTSLKSLEEALDRERGSDHYRLQTLGLFAARLYLL